MQQKYPITGIQHVGVSRSFSLTFFHHALLIYTYSFYYIPLLAAGFVDELVLSPEVIDEVLKLDIVTEVDVTLEVVTVPEVIVVRTNDNEE